MRHTIFRMFRAVLGPFSTWARRRRMATFTSTIRPVPKMRVLDLGGQPQIWDSIETPLEITCLNLPGIAMEDHPTHHAITYVEGDACHMPEFADRSFDLVFSNSVIEHVGDAERRQAFSREVRRLSDRHWIQTPSKLFPIEAHCGMPFWFFYPRRLRSFFIERWRKKLPNWTEMVEGTTVVSARELRSLFPDSDTKIEWLVVPKSLIAVTAPS